MYLYMYFWKDPVGSWQDPARSSGSLQGILPGV